MARVVVVGSYGVGMTMRLERVPGPGETVHGLSYASGPGGKGSNQAIACARLGATVSLCTAIGDDDLARAALKLWAHEGVDTTLVQTLPGSTMVGFILVEPTGENRIAIAPGVLADFAPADLTGLAATLDGADMLLVGLEIPVETAHAALRIGKECGVTTLLNPAPAPAAPLPAGMLDLVDHLTPNRVEAAMLAGLPLTAAPADLLGAAAFDGVANVVLTLGAEGVLMRHGAATRAVAALRVTPIDTTGAGDAFNAAYATQIASGAQPDAAASYACRAAAHSVTVHEVVPSLPYPHDVEKIMSTSAAAPSREDQ